MKALLALMVGLMLAVPALGQVTSGKGMVDKFPTGDLPTCSATTTQLHGYRVYDTTTNQEMTCSEDEAGWVISGGTAGGPTAQDTVFFCGELGANTVEFFGGPNLLPFTGDASIDGSPGSALCNTLGNSTVATVDAPIDATQGYRVNGMYCQVTKGAATTAETVITFVESTANTAVTCTVPLGTGLSCFSAPGLYEDVAANAPVAISTLNGTDDESAEDFFCRVSITWQ